MDKLIGSKLFSSIFRDHFECSPKHNDVRLDTKFKEKVDIFTIYQNYFYNLHVNAKV